MFLITWALHLILWIIRALFLTLFGGLFAGFLAGQKHKDNREDADEWVKESRESGYKLPR